MGMSNNRLLESAGLGLGGGSAHAQGGGNLGNLGNMNEWGGPLSLNLQPIYSPMAQQ